MHWTQEALEELAKVPKFVRDMAKKAVEHEVNSSGRTEIEAADVQHSRDKYLGIVGKKSDKSGPRIAVVRCETVSEVCPGVACFKAFNQRKIHFKDYGPDAEIVGFFTCGGCPGRRISRLVDNLKKYGLDVVHLSSCMLLEGTYPACPHIEEIKKNLELKGIKVVEGTHH
jgi:predicted metal-binding protein